MIRRSNLREKEKIRDKPFILCIDRKDHEHFFQHLGKVFEEGENFERELHLKRDDGTRFRASLHSVKAPVSDPGEPSECWTVIIDITQKQKLLDRIEENARRFNALFNSSLDMIMIVNDSSNFIEVNDVACKKLGYSRKELLKLGIYDITAPRLRSRLGSIWEEFRQSGSMKGEYMVITKDGTLMDVEFSAIFNFIEGKHLSILSDVTDKKRREKKIIDQAEQLKLVNDILRHDLKNYFGSIINAVDLYRQDAREELLEIVSKNGRSGLDLIGRMKDVSSMVSANGEELKEIDVDRIIEKVSSDHPEIEIEKKIECNIVGDRAFASLMENLISNAERHGGADRVRITSGPIGNYCRIEVSDNGKGIPDQIKERVFDESFKYGDTAQTGIGLYIARKIVNRFKGEIWVEDSEEGGALFIMELPLPRP